MDERKEFIVTAKFTILQGKEIKNKEDAIEFVKANLVIPNPFHVNNLGKLNCFKLDCEEEVYDSGDDLPF